MQHESELRNALKKYWGFDDFLPLQLDAMNAVMNNRDSLCVFPTGGGKSLCFQAPAVCQEGLGIVYVGAHSMLSGNYMSEHDRVISEKLGFVLCGGDLSENTVVSEQYLLDLERKAFLELCTEKKTLERLESIVKKGKILRN